MGSHNINDPKPSESDGEADINDSSFMSVDGADQTNGDLDDTATLITASELLANNPQAFMNYDALSGTFGDDSTTLVGGVEGTSSKVSGFSSRKQAAHSALNASAQQLHYNQSRLALDRAINQTMQLLNELTEENLARPVFYPTDVESNSLLNSHRAHLALVRNNASTKQLEKTLQKEDIELPEFNVLRLNLKIDHTDNNLMENLDKKSIANLLTKKFTQQIKYLENLKDRVDDTSSKVFVTGDLNAGKSTFCNSLLRRKILPEDQQPCTSVFCEVVDASRENNSLEEVHAIPIGKVYKASDESTYEVYPLKDLDDLVYECDKYSLLKVYILDNRPQEESLLHNGVIDIKLIDAPGLNMDSYQTTQVFSRQEEIDLVIFVVNSENHFTLSAKEFITTANSEKRYVFIVVNKFDSIRNKERCKTRILDQVKTLSPDTYKNSSDFVHFVSSNNVMNGLPDDGGDGDGDGDDDDPPNPDFDQLEASLRKFVLEKRAISKLLPAKDYLLNILKDLDTLSVINEKIYAQEKEDKQKELKSTVSPKYDEITSASIKISDSITSLIDRTSTAIYNKSKMDIVNTLQQLGDSQVMEYHGLHSLYEYAKGTQQIMMEKITDVVVQNEKAAKDITVEKVDEITKFGKQHLGEEFLHDKVFQSDLMFTRKRDNLIKKIDNSIDVSDFFDPSFESFFLWVGLPKEMVSTTRQQINYYNPTQILTSLPSPSSLTSSSLSVKDQFTSLLTLLTLYSSGKWLTTGALVRKLFTFSTVVLTDTIKKVAIPVTVIVTGISIYYLVSDIPNAFPRNQARKITKQIQKMDYAHVNASRISKECTRVLNYPSRQVMNNFQTSIDKRASEKKKLEAEIRDALQSYSYFHSMLTKVQRQRGLVEEIDLESVYVVD